MFCGLYALPIIQSCIKTLRKVGWLVGWLEFNSTFNTIQVISCFKEKYIINIKI